MLQPTWWFLNIAILRREWRLIDLDHVSIYNNVDPSNIPAKILLHWRKIMWLATHHRTAKCAVGVVDNSILVRSAQPKKRLVTLVQRWDITQKCADQASPDLIHVVVQRMWWIFSVVITSLLMTSTYLVYAAVTKRLASASHSQVRLFLFLLISEPQ